jgi:tetratricopeptide (TPR) repeat protein
VDDQKISEEIKTHPKVLLARLELLLEMKRPDDGTILGESLCGLWPEEPQFHLLTAYCLREQKQTRDALETLNKAPARFLEMPDYLYNIACYEIQLGNLIEAKKVLTKCFDKDKRFREDALEDPDLEPL